MLAPEFWVAVSEATGIAELRRTTRDEPDYPALMEHRRAMMEAHGLGFARVRAVVAAVEPLDGALGFLDELHHRGCEVVIVSDTFEQLVAGFLPKLATAGRPAPPIECHTLVIADDRIAEFRYRHGHKAEVVSALARRGRTVAVGDGFNDLAMLAAADAGVLYRPSAEVRAAAPDVPVVDTYEAVLAGLADISVR